MEVNRITGYTEHGCTFVQPKSGDLVLIDYSAELRADPRWGRFGAMVTYDYLDKAKELLRETYNTFDVLLSIPDLVAIGHNEPQATEPDQRAPEAASSFAEGPGKSPD